MVFPILDAPSFPPEGEAVGDSKPTEGGVATPKSGAGACEQEE